MYLRKLLDYCCVLMAVNQLPGQDSILLSLFGLCTWIYRIKSQELLIAIKWIICLSILF